MRQRLLTFALLKPLTVDFREPRFTTTVRDENRQPFWFQRRADDQKDATRPWGPANPQALNRYAYVQNNPVRYTDPTGRWTVSVCILCGSIFGATGIRGGITVAADLKGNVGVFVGAGGGAYAGAGFSLEPSVAVTSASTVDKLAGYSVQLGGQLGEGLGVNAEAVAFKDSDTGKLLYGLSAGGKATVEVPFPGELHSTLQYDRMVAKVNVPNEVRRLGNYVQGRVSEYVRRNLDATPIYRRIVRGAYQ